MFYRGEVAITKKNGAVKYSIGRCTGKTYGFEPFPENIPETSERLWRITKSPDALQIHCNGLKVLEYLFNSSHPTDEDLREICENLWSGESKGKLELLDIDKATKKIRVVACPESSQYGITQIQPIGTVMKASCGFIECLENRTWSTPNCLGNGRICS
eukprot:sb/3473027/